MVKLLRSALLCLPFLGLLAAPAGALSDEEQLKRYVLGNTLATLFHELGHGLVSEFELPVLGREEDAVDTFSVIEMTDVFDYEDIDDDRAEEMDYYLWATLDGWVALTEVDEDHDAYDYAGEHSLDEQRFYNHLCLIYGSDPDYYADLVEDFEVDEELVENCEEKYAIAASSWTDLMDSYEVWRAEDEEAEDDIRVRIKRAPGALARYQDWVATWFWLPYVESYVEETFDFPRRVNITFESCGEANAYWDPSRREVSMCYELMDEYAGFWPGPVEWVEE